MSFVLSPRFYTDTKLDLSKREINKPFGAKEGGKDVSITLVDIYKDRVDGWFLDIARFVRTPETHGNPKIATASGFVVLMVAIGFFEAHARFLFGVNTDKHSKVCFVKSFTLTMSPLIKIEPSAPNVREDLIRKAANAMYDHVRNGLFHESRTRGVWIVDPTKEESVPAVTFWWSTSKERNVRIRINPLAFIEVIQSYFDSYINDLEDESNLKSDALRENFKVGWKSDLPVAKSKDCIPHQNIKGQDHVDFSTDQYDLEPYDSFSYSYIGVLENKGVY